MYKRSRCTCQPVTISQLCCWLPLMGGEAVITGTGFSGEARHQVRASAEACGASYSGDLQKGVTDYLVVKQTGGVPGKLGLKIVRALQWGIPVARWEWLRASAQARVLLPIQPDQMFPTTVVSEADIGSSGEVERLPTRKHTASSHSLERPSRSDSDDKPSLSHIACQAENIAPTLPRQTVASFAETELSSSDGTCSIPSSPDGSIDETAHLREDSTHTTTATTAAVYVQQNDGLAPRDKSTGQSLETDKNIERRQALDTVSAGNSMQEQETHDACRLELANRSSSEDDVECLQTLSGDAASARALLRLTLASSPCQRAAQTNTRPASHQAATFGSPISQPPVPNSDACAKAAATAETVAASASSPASSAMCPKTLHDRFSCSPSANTGTLDTVASAWRSKSHMGGSMAASAVQRASAGDGSIVVLKGASRQRRGSTLCTFHVLNRKQLQRVTFAESVQVVSRGLILNCRDRRTAIVIQPQTQPSPLQPQSLPIVAELKSLYCLPDGCWWAEYMPFLSAADLDSLAQQRGMSSIALPADFEISNERLRSIHCLHCPLLDISGQRTIRHSKTAGRIKSTSGLFWRSCFDPELMRCVTDKPVSAFVS